MTISQIACIERGGLLLCNDTDIDLHLVILNTLHSQLPSHSKMVTRRLFLGHMTTEGCTTSISYHNIPLIFRYS